MVYWIGYNKTGVGEVIRERGYDSLVKTRRVAATVMKKEGYDWVTIFRSKTARYHIETLEKVRGGKTVVEKYNKDIGRFDMYWLDDYSGKLRVM